jgi:TIR domain
MRVFLSYASEDRDVARELASHLTKAGLDTWDPAEALFPGDNWALRIGEALKKANAMVVLISPDSVKSEWVQHEVQYALGASRYKGRLIPAIVRPTKDIPWILKKFPTVPVGKDLLQAAREIADYIKHGFRLAPAAA